MSNPIEAYDPAVDAPAHHHPIYDYESGPPVDRGKFAIWLFLATEVMFFTGLIGTYIVLRMGTETWPNPESRLEVDLTALNTFILITSSWMMVLTFTSTLSGSSLYIAGSSAPGRLRRDASAMPMRRTHTSSLLPPSASGAATAPSPTRRPTTG